MLFIHMGSVNRGNGAYIWAMSHTGSTVSPPCVESSYCVPPDTGALQTDTFQPKYWTGKLTVLYVAYM